MVIVENGTTTHCRDFNLKSELRGIKGERWPEKNESSRVKSVIAYFHVSLGKPSK